MNQQQAIEFIQSLNAIQDDIAPKMFNRIANSQVGRMVLAVAQGQAVCEIKAAPPPPQTAPAASSQA